MAEESGNKDLWADLSDDDPDFSAKFFAIAEANGISAASLPDDAKQRFKRVTEKALQQAISADQKFIRTSEGDARLAELVRIAEKYDKEAGLGIGVDLEYGGFVAPEIADQNVLYEESLKPPDWIVNQVYTRDCRGMICAESKAGKTFIVCSIGLSVASGQLLFGDVKIMDPGPVLFVAGEDDIGEMGRRLRRMCFALGLNMRNVPLRFLDARKIRLDRDADVRFLQQYIKDEGIRMTFFDPIARLMDGDENKKEVVAKVLNPLGDLASESNSIVQIVHHLRKQNPEANDPIADRIRGSTDFASWFMTALLFEGSVRDGRIRCSLLQRISGNLPTEFSIDVVETEAEALGDLTSMRLRANLEGETASSQLTRDQMIERAADDIAVAVEQQPGRWATRSEIRALTGFNADLVNAAVKRLIANRGTASIQQTPVRVMEQTCVVLVGSTTPRLSQERVDRDARDAFEEPEGVAAQQADLEFPLPEQITDQDIDDLYDAPASPPSDDDLAF